MLDSVTTSATGMVYQFGLEIVVLVAFFAAWHLTSPFFKKKAVYIKNNKGKQATGQRKTTTQTALQVLSLCETQFTRALRLYREMIRREEDRVITNEQFYISLIEAAARVGKADVTEQIVSRMAEIGVKPSLSFLQSVLKLFVARRFYHECLLVWKLFPASPDKTLYSCLALAAAEVDKVDDAKHFVFELTSRYAMPNREYMPLFRCFVRQKSWEKSYKLIDEFLQQGVLIDNLVLNTALSACAFAPTSQVARGVLESVLMDPKQVSCGCVDTISFNTVIKSCARKGEVTHCFELLDRLINTKLKPDDVTFSTLLDVCIDNDEHDLASHTIEKMTSAGVQMNCVLMTTLMKGFIRNRRLDKAMELYDSMRKGVSPVKPDMVTFSILIKAHCDELDMNTALSLLEAMLEAGFNLDDVVFTHLIEGCCQVQNVELAEKFFHDMTLARVQPSVFTFTSLIKVYGKCGLSEKAMALVDCMESKYGVFPTVVVHSCLISGLLRHKKYIQAWQAFEAMMKTCDLDGQAASIIITGMTDGRMWKQMMQVAELAMQRTPPLRIAPQVYNHALHQLCLKGQTSMARQLYKNMVAKNIPVTVEGIRRRLNLK